MVLDLSAKLDDLGGFLSFFALKFLLPSAELNQKSHINQVDYCFLLRMDEQKQVLNQSLANRLEVRTMNKGDYLSFQRSIQKYVLFCKLFEYPARILDDNHFWASEASFDGLDQSFSEYSFLETIREIRLFWYQLKYQQICGFWGAIRTRGSIQNGKEYFFFAKQEWWMQVGCGDLVEDRKRVFDWLFMSVWRDGLDTVLKKSNRAVLSLNKHLHQPQPIGMIIRH